jgi:hypothetical protein
MNNAYKRFQPATIKAADIIRELTVRGGMIITDREEYVEIRRLESVAKIDQLGRVEWNKFSSSI